MTRSRVDLPPPLGPSSAVSEPDAMSTDTSRSTGVAPNDLFTCRTSIAISWLLRRAVPWVSSRMSTAISASTVATAKAAVWSKFW